MVKRLWVSLFHPKQLAFFLKDKIGNVLFYLFTLLFIAILPSILYIIIVNPLDSNTEQQIISRFIQEASACQIDHGTLSCETNETMNYNGFVISFNEPINSYTNQFVFESEALVFYTANMEFTRFTYLELGITNLDLSLTEASDQIQFKEALHQVYDELGYIYQIGNGIATYINQVFILFVMVFIITMTYGLRVEKLKFRYRFIFASYSMTSYLVTLFIAQLYGIEFIIYIGMILPYIFMDQAYKGLLSMSKIVISKKDEDTHE